MANPPGKVIYVKGGKESLKSGKHFSFENKDYFDMYAEPQYQPEKVSAEPMISAPYFYSYSRNKYLFKGNAKDLLQAERFLEDDSFDLFNEPLQQVFNAQHAMNSYGFTQEKSPELQAAKKLKGNPEDWIILLRAGSYGVFMWGDAGELFYVIHKSDLMKKDFSNVFVTLESS